jgi:O-antigen/teichoic acid export membrane protein
MFGKISEVLKSKTFRQSIITVSATFLSSGLGAVFYTLIARGLGPADYGLFSLCIAILMLLVSVGDLGSSQGMVRFVGKNAQGDYKSYASLALRIKLITGFIIIISLWLFAEPISRQILNQPLMIKLLPWVGLGAICQMLMMYSTSLSQSLQRFAVWGVIQVGGNLFRLLLLFFIIAGSILTVQSGMLIFSLAAVSGFFLSWLWLDRKIWLTNIPKEVYREFWNFNRWTATYVILSSIVSRIDTLISARYLNLSQVGYYALAGTMAYFMPQLSTALGAVTSAKFAGINSSENEKKFLSKAVIFNSGVAIAVALIMIPTAWIVIQFTGKDYTNSLVPFLIMLAGLVIFMTTNPIRDSILYYHGDSKFFVYLTIFQGISITVLTYLLIFKYQVIGAATATALSMVLVSVISASYYYLKYFLKSKSPNL